jgi:Site-specific recombinases, DNA invertase Pin homologs
MNAAIYARYSSDGQREESIEGQLRICNEYAERNGITIINTYIDRAYSGRNDDRPEFQRMLRDSSKKVFDVLLLYKLDRFARNREDSAINKAILKRNGVRVVSATEVISPGPEGIILEAVLEGVAEYYSAELSEKVIRGLTENALKCKYNGGVLPFGYRIDEERHFQIDELTAPIIQEIFTRYSDDETVREIVTSLNERGIKSASCGAFTKNSMQAMLRNRRYLGEYRYGTIVVADGIPAIIDQEMFDKVQKRLDRNKRAPAVAKAKVDYLLSTKLFCGMCGAFMVGESGTSRTGKTHNYYKCATVKKSKECKKKSVKKEYIEQKVIMETKRVVFADEVIEMLADSVIEYQKLENKILPMLQDELKQIEKSIENMLDAIQQPKRVLCQPVRTLYLRLLVIVCMWLMNASIRER